MEKVQYPKWKYHPKKEALIVQSHAEEKALGSGWFESPADFSIESESDTKSDKEGDEKKKKASGGAKA